MKNFFILLTVILIFLASAAAQDNNTSTNNPKKAINALTVIDFSTGGKTGHLVYREEYYVKDGSGELKLDNIRTYFDGNVNKSNVRLRISRPPDKQGKLYSSSMIKVIATLNNETILEGFYKDQPKNSTTNTSKPSPSSNNSVDSPSMLKKLPGFDALVALVAIGLTSVAYLRRRT